MKRLPEMLVFGLIFAVFMIDLNPDYTFVNKAADSIGYLFSAKYLYPSYHTSPPLYLLTSHFFLMLPFGTDAWKMGLVSVLSSMGACLFIYLIIMRETQSRFYSLLGVLTYGLSALVISQTVVVQTYATVCLLATGAYYYSLKKQWKLMGMMLGMGLVVHLLMAGVFGIMFMAHKEYRKNWKALGITFAFLVFYAYIPLTNRPPYMWFPNPESNLLNSVWFFVGDTWSTIVFLLGKLAIWDLPKRVLDASGVLLVSLGVLGVVPIILYFKGRKLSRDILFWLIAFPTALFISELDMNTYDYMMLTIPFAAIAASIGLARMYDYRWPVTTVVGLSVIGFGLFNLNYFDIGRTLDPNMSASNLMHNEFDKLPDGAIFMPNIAGEWEAIYKYNADNNKHIIPVCKDILPSEAYLLEIQKQGVKVNPSRRENMSVAALEMAQSIILLNPNVYTTIIVEPQTFGGKVVKANGDMSLIIGLDQATATYLEKNPKWAWKLSNPYDIISTQITVKEWTNQILSSFNVMFFTELAILGLFINWLGWKVIKRNESKDKGSHQAHNQAKAE